MSKLFLSCEEASHVCDKAQYKESSVLDIIKLKIHILFCGLCKEHSKKNKKLSETIEKSNITCLDAKSKSEMKKCLEAEMNKKDTKS